MKLYYGSKIIWRFFSTITAFRYGARDINKLEAGLLIKLANSLCVKVESLLADINLIFDVT